MKTPMKRTQQKNPKREPQPQLRVKASEGDLTTYRETARRFGYSEMAPFVRRLLDAASRSNPDTGLIQFFRGSDGVGDAFRAA